MLNNRKDLFAAKFNFNCEEKAEEINWSSSNSSDLDISNQEHKSALKTQRKRKRNRRKSNISNLNVTIIDNNKNINPLMERKHKVSKQDKDSTPVKTEGNQWDKALKSPILTKKYGLTEKKNNIPKLVLPITNTSQELNRSPSPVLFSQRSSPILLPDTRNKPDLTKAKQKSSQKENEHINNTNIINNDVLQKAQSYFESYFSSSTPHSINEETSTQKTVSVPSKTNSEIEIMLSSNASPLKPRSISLETDEPNEKNKKKYRKDSLAYRLDNLLKKQQMNISLWQHEKYLAKHSKFVIPKEDFKSFVIKKCVFNFGCNILNATDLIDNENFIIVINNCYTNDMLLVEDIILKLYNPFNIIIKDNKKCILNACKFETLVMNNNKD